MAESGEPERDATEQSPYVKLPTAAVAIGLAVLLAAALAFGIFANQNLRSRSPVQQTVGSATVVPVAVRAQTPEIAATATAPSEQAATPAAVTPQVSSPTLQPVQTPAALLPRATPSVQPTVDPVVADEIGRAYVNFWQVRSHALLYLDPSQLSEVMDGDYLASVEHRIEQLRSEGRAIKTQASLNYSVVEVTDDSASIVDDFTDDSFYVKIGTEEPLTSPTADELSVLYRLKRLSGAWKVVDSARSN